MDDDTMAFFEELEQNRLKRAEVKKTGSHNVVTSV